MMPYITTTCPNCEKDFEFSKWDPGFQEFGNVECPHCSAEFNEKSKTIIEADEYREIVCHHCKQKFKILKGYAFMYACPYCRRLLRG